MDRFRWCTGEMGYGVKMEWSRWYTGGRVQMVYRWEGLDGIQVGGFRWYTGGRI